MGNQFEDYHEYSDEELTKTWNYLETLKLSDLVEAKMDYIERYLLDDRSVVAWNHKGEITLRDVR
jgi:hypothetical protein